MGYEAISARFWEINDREHLGGNTTMLYFYLLKLYNENSKRSFSYSDVDICKEIGIARTTIIRVREKLRNAGLIDFETKSFYPCEYKIILPYSEDESSIEGETIEPNTREELLELEEIKNIDRKETIEYPHTYENSENSTLTVHQEDLWKKETEYPYISLDIIRESIGGFKNGNLSIIAGRTGMGKTALMIQMIIDLAKSNKSVGVFSLEMSSLDIIERLLTNSTNIPNTTFRRYTFSEADYEIYFEKKHELKRYKIHISDSASLFSIENLYRQAKIYKRRYAIDILFVDYLQLISCDKAKGDGILEISIISKKLKSLAKELDIPVVALSQLSRNVENRYIKRPMLSDLRGSGSLEQDADEVIFLYRPEYYNIDTWDYYNDESTSGEAEIIISKNRYGQTGAGRCKVDLPTSRFYNL